MADTSKAAIIVIGFLIAAPATASKAAVAAPRPPARCIWVAAPGVWSLHRFILDDQKRFYEIAPDIGDDVTLTVTRITDAPADKFGSSYGFQGTARSVTGATGTITKGGVYDDPNGRPYDVSFEIDWNLKHAPDSYWLHSKTVGPAGQPPHAQLTGGYQGDTANRSSDRHVLPYVYTSQGATIDLPFNCEKPRDAASVFSDKVPSVLRPH